MRRYYQLHLSLRDSSLIWTKTYHLFDELKVIIMGDGYNIGRALLLEGTK